VITVNFPRPVTVTRALSVRVTEASPVPRVNVVYRGPPGVSGNAASLSGLEGNSAYIEEDGGIFVPPPQLSSALW